MNKNTAEHLIEQYGCKMIPLELCLEYAGYKTLKTAQASAVNLVLPFPAFKTGGRNGKWFVNAEHLAKYLDEQDREYTEKFNYLHN